MNLKINTLIITGLGILFSSLVFGQETIRKFIVNQDELRPIPFAVIKNTTKQISWVADKNGSFEFDVKDIALTDFLTFSALGYHDKSVPYIIIKDTGIINLKVRSFTTNEIKNKLKGFKSKKLGNRFKTIKKDSVSDNEAGVLFTNCDSIIGLIESIHVFVEEKSLKPIEINLYKYNKLKKSIGGKLLKEPIYIRSENNQQWLSVNLTFNETPVTEDGFLLSIKTNPSSEFTKQYNGLKAAELGTFKNIKGTAYKKENGKWILTPNSALPFATYVTILTE